jgi:molybdopterin converting factor small subunit
MCTLVLPQALSGLTGGVKQLDLAGDTVADVLDALAAEHPVLARRIRDEQGQLRRFVNLYIDGEDARSIGGLAAQVPARAEVLVLPSVAGG